MAQTLNVSKSTAHEIQFLDAKTVQEAGLKVLTDVKKPYTTSRFDVRQTIAKGPLCHRKKFGLVSHKT